MNRIILAIALILVLAMQGYAQNRKTVETTTDVLMFVPGAVGAGVSLLKGDKEGFWQLAGSGATAVAASYLLKYTIRKERPDGSDKHSFPSNHTAVAFAGAAYLQRRYGWGYGVPAYAVGAYVAWGRVYSKRHDIWDVLAGTAIGVGSAYIYTRPFAKQHNVVIGPSVTPDGGPAIYFSMNF
ncbi:MAG: phosphatase PAP2 family protein [Bacteroidaceae bacterium]|nr:phosphatase PAP2 family protein [Bacteroidaceae bacterium]